MSKIIVHQGQSLFDIALQESGSVLAAFDLALKNGKSITDELNVGAELTPCETEFLGISTKEYFLNTKIATNSTFDDENIINIDFGIGLMEIEETFIIR
jgi:hypothetical protein